MYHSIQIIPDDGTSVYVGTNTTKLKGVNTWDDWHLIPASRPLFNPPGVRTNYIEIPGMDGILDATEILSGRPLYENRTGSNEFYVMNGYGSWAGRYSEIMNYLHGKKVKAILEDDPFYYYYGRMSVNQWKSEKDWSKITLDYDFYPYKMEARAAHPDGDWLWDPFSFVDGIIRKYSDYHSIDLPYTDEGGTTHYSITKSVPNNAMAATPSFGVRSLNSSGTNDSLTISMTDGTGKTYPTQTIGHQNYGVWVGHKFAAFQIEPNLTAQFTFTSVNNTPYEIHINFRGGRL